MYLDFLFREHRLCLLLFVVDAVSCVKSMGCPLEPRMGVISVVSAHVVKSKNKRGNTFCFFVEDVDSDRCVLL